MASGRPSWLSAVSATRGRPLDTTTDAMVNITGGWQHTATNWSDVGSGWRGSGSGGSGGKPSWVSGDREGGIFTTVKYLNLIGNPTLFAFVLIGLCLAILTATRRNIRNYSSAVYLSVMFFCDVIWVAGNYLPDYAASVNEDLVFNDSICMYIQAFRFIGRLGTSFVIIALVLERVLMLAKPAKFVELAKPRTAMLISFCCLLVVTGLGVYYLHNSYWDPKSEKCNYRNSPSRDTMAPQSLMKLGLIGGTLIIQVILNVVLGLLIWRKRRFQASDPIQSSLASARRHTKQLNRINLIAFIMSLQYILTNIPLLVAPSIYWRSLTRNLIDFGTLKLIVKVIDLFALLMISSRAFMVGLASRKIRQETWLAITCTGEPNNIKQLAIDIRPKQSGKQYGSNPDIVSKWNFQEKSMEA